MKTFRIIGMVLMAVLLSASFTSCSEDDDEESVGGKETLIGMWQTTHDEGYTKIDGKVDEEWNDNITSEEDADRWEFLEDGTAKSYYWTGSQWADDNIKSWWTLEGNKLHFGSLDDDAYTVKVLNASQLVIELHVLYTEDGENVETYEKVIFKRVTE